ncbi:flavocytochrome c [Tetragenococcus koreensis]|uniref:Fumarate reductase flavoprotein subunit n=1 Tax=Tetragenococcus koreensis TaxID=290335 RepID=A0AAN4UCH8_9ENTE|nr:flavocytochrome c [Tetragenococcus koreensis]AYW46412.1 flavocytochrome c [Tetragenococcus koreensis]GEN91478.1 flavocytochrome c [Tetragenococcus koreensis]GEQ49888.1 fumarate reductase flavoprotein subunit [Tetragenococcus koreensis]GEQ52371.1 fumarate reductase flavoprotein subunit [Tetragenococcus koreensis]GEQ54910.1 fumarate reductase flavoprotein subunit [Tetragenococcus koreensis]
MKKLVNSLLVLSSTIVFSACGVTTPDNVESSSEATNQSTEESADAASGASEQEEYADPSELEDNYDVVIVGAGGAGMSAAIQAKEDGANPVILEKLPVAGGNTTKSSGGMNASETKFQEAEDIEDSNDTFYDDTLEGGQETNDKELLRYFVDHSSDAIDWLDNMGITLNNISYSGGASVQRIHRPEDGSAVGGYLVEGLLRNVDENDIPIFVNTDVTKINEENGQVNGVEIEVNGDKQTIDADAVAVTTGGYGANEEMIEEYRPDLEGYVSTNSEGSTGDGIKMIEELGGQTVDMDQIQVHPTVIQEDGTLVSETVRGEGAILVDQKGERFFNEMETRDKVSDAITDLPEEGAYLIFDDALANRAKQVDFYQEQGFVESGDTIEELAQEIDVPADNLTETLDSWNEAVDNEEDSDFGRETAMDYDLTEGPFYAIKIAPGIHHTMGGVKINTDTKVLDEEDQAISGLYAAGELTGGLHGNNRIGGNAVADIVIFGRQAGTQATKFAQENN